MRIAVAVSGGVDSLYALLALREQGHEVTALHARFLHSPPSGDPVPGLARVCARLGVPLRVTDLSAAFEQQVISPFVQAHALALTPNPCAYCNRAMKFGLLLDEALQPSDGSPPADAMATGHYVALNEHPRYGFCLKAGSDPSRDQSYFLALTPVPRLRRCVFPLGAERKDAIRKRIRESGLEVPQSRESREICFVPHDDHRAFLEKRALSAVPGPVLLDDPDWTPARGPGGRRWIFQDGKPIIGQHGGLWRYTEGQRKGLGLAWIEPLFVLARDRERNALVVGPASRLTHRVCTASQVNIMVDPTLWPERVLARIRYRQQPAPAEVRVEQGPDGPVLRLVFAQAQLPPAPGQVAAVFDAAGFVLAGGIILPC